MRQPVHRRFAWAALLFAAVVVAPVAAETKLVPHEAQYKIKISLLGGTLNTRVYDVGNRYMARSIITPTGFASLLMSGSIVEQSEFGLTPAGIRPRHYESVDTLTSDPKTMSFDFDWTAQAVAGSINDEEFVFEFDGAVHDRVSIQYELMLNLLEGEPTEHYALLDGDELKQLTITNVGTRSVEVPFGRFEAVGIRHQAENSSRVSTLWCVEELNYLPVVIEQHRKGKLRVRAELTDYRPMPAADAEAVGQLE